MLREAIEIKIHPNFNTEDAWQVHLKFNTRLQDPWILTNFVTPMDRPGLYELETCSAQHSGALAALRLLNSYNHLLTPPGAHNVMGILSSLPPPPQPTCLQPYCQHATSRSTPILTGTICENEIRRRGEKRPIPQELKDEKYFERRRRNNQAAKKSRDARRIREDQIAWRACLLEQENASLRAHVSALRQEALALRALLAARDVPPPPAQPVPSSTTD